jgi:hypothetical protein
MKVLVDARSACCGAPVRKREAHIAGRRVLAWHHDCLRCGRRCETVPESRAKRDKEVGQ